MPRIQVCRVAVPILDARAAPLSFLPPDGRQSEEALEIRRGMCRRLRAGGYAALSEVPLPNGRRADLLALSGEGEILIVEVKSSVDDFRSDSKWPEYGEFCDRFTFATGPHVPQSLFPEEAGLAIADAYGAEIVREGPLRPVASARRKAMLVRFARLAAHRLHDLDDPDGARGSC